MSSIGTISEVKIELNHDGFYDLLNSAEAQALCVSEAEKMAAGAAASSGGEYEVETFHSSMNGGRCAAAVRTADKTAMVAEAEYGTLIGQVH